MTQVEALMEIARRDGGVVTPAAVIEAAKPEGSPLHGAFTWDDSEAAAKYRVIEAQRLIRRCEIVIERGDEKVRTFAFVGISTDREDGAAAHNPYRIASEVSKDPDLLSVAESDALDQLKALKRRYEHLKRLSAVWAAIDEAAK